MKLPFKLHNMRRRLAVTGGLALAISTLAALSAAAADVTAPIPATTTLPNSTTTPSTQAPAKTSGTDSKSVTTAAAQDTSSDGDLVNWVTLGFGGSFVNGDTAQFQHLKHTKSGAIGGVEDFHWEQAIGKSAQMTVDGHALVGQHDYAFKFDLTDEKLGYIRAGYTEFRTWYDGNGGFYPPDKQQFNLYDNNLWIDRRSGWIEVGLTLPDLPVFSLRYEYDSRKGLMDSTSWGDNDSGTPTNLPADRKIVPTFLSIDEQRNIFEGNVSDKFGNTDAGLTMRYEIDTNKDGTFENLAPTQPSAGAFPTSGNKRFVTNYDVEDNSIFNLHGFQKTFLDDHVVFSSGLSYSNEDTNLGGSRIYGPAYDDMFPLTPVPSAPPTISNNGIGAGFLNLSGGGFTKEYVGNTNLMITPFKDLTLISAVRLQYDDSDLVDNYTNTSAPAQPPTTGNTTGLTPQVAHTNNWDLGVAESFEARYTGFRDWSLYATAEFDQDWGNNSWNTKPVLNEDFNQDWNRFAQKYTVGANWYPLVGLNFGGQYYHQIHDYDYYNRLNTGTSVGAAGNNTSSDPRIDYPSVIKAQYLTTDDMNFRVTWQALSNVLLVTRYDFQYSTVDTTVNPDSGTTVVGGTHYTYYPAEQAESCNISNHIISENITWTPLACLSLDVGGSYVLNTVNTPVSGSASVDQVVLTGMNNYWTVDGGIGYALDTKTDLRVQYTYYRADDYENNASSATTSAATPANAGLPYGADTEEHNLTATITRQINKALQVSLKYGYSKYTDGSVGNQDNYEAHLVYGTVKYQF